MVVSINVISEPVGSITTWIRPDNTIPLPFGWLICDGSTVSDSSSSFDGKTIPDLRSQFLRGHATLTNATFGADTLYFTGGTIPTGGADTVDRAHPHGLNSHTHTMSGTTSTFSAPNLNYFNTGGPATTGPHSHTFSGTTASGSGTTDFGLVQTENKPSFLEIVTIIKIK